MSTTQEWIDELKSISVLELSERIKALEEEFGVSATAVAAAAPAGGGGVRRGRAGSFLQVCLNARGAPPGRPSGPAAAARAAA